MKISGWLETERGADMFEYEGATLRDCARQLVADYPEDAGETDMEAMDQDGADVTQRLYRLAVSIGAGA